MDLTSMTRQLREHCGLIGDDQSEIPNLDTSDKTGAYTYLNRSYWEILDKVKFREKDIVSSFPTVYGTSFYHVPSSFEAIQSLSIIDINDGKHIPVDRITPDYYEQQYVSDPQAVNAYGKPEKYFRFGAGIKLWPTPDDIYTLKIYYWSELADLSSGNLDPAIPRVWHEIIMFGGVWRAQMGALRDSVGAQISRSWQATLISNISPVDEKEKDDSHRAGLEVLGLDCEL